MSYYQLSPSPFSLKEEELSFLAAGVGVISSEQAQQQLLGSTSTTINTSTTTPSVSTEKERKEDDIEFKSFIDSLLERINNEESSSSTEEKEEVTSGLPSSVYEYTEEEKLREKFLWNERKRQQREYEEQQEQLSSLYVNGASRAPTITTNATTSSSSVSPAPYFDQQQQQQQHYSSSATSSPSIRSSSSLATGATQHHNSSSNAKFDLFWNNKYNDLIEYKRLYGNCDVPTNFHNKSLKNWVNNQRAQYRYFKHPELQKKSSMTLKRIQKLEQIGFNWHSSVANSNMLDKQKMHFQKWQDKYMLLQEFRRVNGHTDVPSDYAANLQLARWVITQRAQYRYFRQGKKAHINQERIQKLLDIGFDFKYYYG